MTFSKHSFNDVHGSDNQHHKPSRWTLETGSKCKSHDKPNQFHMINSNHHSQNSSSISLSTMKHFLTTFRPTLKTFPPCPLRVSFPSSLTSLHTSRKMSSQPEPKFASNYNPVQGHQGLEPLLKDGGGRWTLLSSGMGIERSFRFKGFKKTWVCRIPLSDLPSPFHLDTDKTSST